MKTISEADVRAAVKAVVDDVIDDFRNSQIDRETVIERLDEETDTLFGQLVRHGRIDQYDVDDLVATAQSCASVIKVAEADAWVEDDYGLWDGLKYGVLASVAYFSLRNLLYQGLKDEGHDTNDDHPFAAEETEVSDVE